MLRGLSDAVRGITGQYELNRLVGAFGGVAYVVGANVFVVWNLATGREFDLVEYAAAFPGGLAVVVGAIAGSVAIKDRNVASAKVTEKTGAGVAPAPPPTGPKGNPPPVEEAR